VTVGRKEFRGTFVYENWNAALLGVTSEKGQEYSLFTDASIKDEIASGLGPYQILNCIADARRYEHGPTRPALVLRVDYCDRAAPFGDVDPSEYGRYHGGNDADEFAALLSLCAGFRLKASSATRVFDALGDPRGRPWSFSDTGLGDPVVPLSAHGATVPRLRRLVDLGATPRQLFRFPRLTPADSIAVVRAARLYQEAVWVAESEPWLTWLLLVTALETGANHWHGKKSASNRHRMHVANEKLEKLLVERCGDDLATEVAEMIGGSLKATQKFIEFTSHFLPGPPDLRPPEAFQLSWEEAALRSAIAKVYDHRSKALHQGLWLPWPMSWPPRFLGTENVERTISSAGGRGGMWKPDEIPMMLHVFEHITRGVLLRWWESMLPEEPTVQETNGE
jgi:hypothetical protein